MLTFKVLENIFLSLQGGCRFQLTRREMKEGVKVLEHLKREHQVLTLYYLAVLTNFDRCPESEKTKTFQIARFLSQKLSGLNP